jgi:hypothetical protein
MERRIFLKNWKNGMLEEWNNAKPEYRRQETEPVNSNQ